MSTPTTTTDARWAGAARWVVALSLIGLALAKGLTSTPAHAHELHGLHDVIELPVVTWAAVIVEGLLGIALLSPLRERVAPWVLLWVGTLFGVLTAFVVLRLPLEACGCFGAMGGTLPSRVLILAGLFILTRLSMPPDVEHSASGRPTTAVR